jgi:hypothetical protein
MSLEHSPARQRLRPRFGKIKDAVDYASVSRSKLYVFAQARPELFRKLGGGTIVDFDVLDEMLDALPIAELKGSKPQAA